MTSVSILDALQLWAEQRPGHLALRYLDAHPDAIGQLTYGELADRVQQAATVIAGAAPAGARVALMLPNCVEYMVAFLAAQQAGMIPVPLMPPPAKGSGTQVNRTSAVVADCSPSLCIVQDDAVAERVRGGVSVITLQTLLAPAHRSPWLPVDLDSTAFLQYTSGSTSMPRGVVVSHRNLSENCKLIAEAFATNGDTVFGGWLPLFHDMGIIGHAIHPLFLGATALFLRPETFLRYPQRWLRMISDYRVVAATAPNFAYDYCVDRVSADPGLDLRSWRVALNGSEPVSSGTLDRFSEKFSVNGFHREAFQPVYGLAEATLLVTSRGQGGSIQEISASLASLSKGLVRTSEDEPSKKIVSVGRPRPGGQVVVWIDAQKRQATELEVGEVLVSGASVCAQYFNKPELSDNTFGFRIPGSEDRYLRTGDLGFVRDGELYITGRSKELIILRGRNYYPQDIEDAAQSAHPDFIAHGGAAFDVEIGGQQRLVLVQEVRRIGASGATEEALKQAASAAVSDALGLALYAVILVARGSLPKTTSGKIERSTSKLQLLAGDFGSYEPAARSVTANADAIVHWWRKLAPEIDCRTMDERRCIPPHLVLEFGNRGLLGLRAPLEAGGIGLGAAEAMRVVREVASVDLTLAAFLGVHNGLAIDPLLKFGTVEQKDRFLRSLASGRMLGAFALTEHVAGSNLRAIRATARRTEGGWTLDGNKVWIGTAAWSGLIVFIAQSYDIDGSYLGMSAFLLPSGTSGVRQGAETMTLGMRAMVQNEVHVDGAWIDDSLLLGRIGQGYEVAQSTVTFGRLGVTAMALGCMQRVVQWLARYTEQREIATGKLAGNAHVAGEIFKIQASTLAIGAMMEFCCSLVDRGEQVPLELLSALKAISSELCWKAVDRALQIFGGRGYDEANAIPQMLRDARLLRIFEGSTEALFAHVGHSLECHDTGILEFIGSRFPHAREKCEAVREQLLGLQTLCRTLQQGDSDHAGTIEKGLHVALGEAAGYLLLEAAFQDHPQVRASDELAKYGGQWLTRNRERVLQEFVDNAASPWAHGDTSLLQELATDIDGCIGDWMPNSMRQDIQRSSSHHRKSTESANHALLETSGATIALPFASHHAVVDRELQVELIAWVGDWIRRRLSIRGAIASDQGFTELGLDSIDAVELLADFGDSFGIEVDASALWEFPNLQSLTGYLASRLCSVGDKRVAESDVKAEDDANRRRDEEEAFERLLEQELRE